MNFIEKKLEEYAEAHTTEESEVLKTIHRETYLKMLMPRMLSGHLQGKFLGYLASISKAKNILEIGSYTGYAAIAMAEMTDSTTSIYCIEKNEELIETLNSNINYAGFTSRIKIIHGDAMEEIQKLSITPDFVFIDADKTNYLNYYKMLIDKMPIGGIIVADNVLWSGKVLELVERRDFETKALIEFSEYIQKDPRVRNILLPVRDGLMLIEKLN